MKRFISVLISFAVVFSTLPVGVAMASGVIETADPFAAMYDSEAVVSRELKLETPRIELEARVEAENEVRLNAQRQNENKELDSGSRIGNRLEETALDINTLESRAKNQKTAEVRQELNETYQHDRYIVKYKSTNSRAIDKIHSGRIQSVEVIGNDINRIELITLPNKINPKTFAEELRNANFAKEIEYIQPDFVLSPDALELELLESDGESDDDNSGDDGFEEIVQPEGSGENETPEENENTEPDTEESEESEETDAPESEESEEVEETDEVTEEEPELPEPQEQPIIVAIIDTGIDSSHPMIAEYMISGWNFTDNTDITYDTQRPRASAHGTHIAGIIAETARETGADIQILPLQVFENGKAYTSDILAAIEYAQEQGAGIINCSFGSTAENPALFDIIQETSALFICAVGNNRRDMAENPSYPAAYRLPNIISVGSVNADGGFSYFSNYSSSFVDITAQGRDVMSAYPENETGLKSGTSMSAAYVTGVAASVSAFSELTAIELRERIIEGADRLSNLQNKSAQGRRVNLANAINNISGQYLNLNPADDFDVHGYQPTASEQWELYESAGKVVQVAAGAAHTLVLKHDGTVWSWGANWYGQLGDGTTDDSSIPVQVVGLTNITHIVAGDYHNLAVDSDGSIWVWGWNSSGQLGTDDTNDRETAQFTYLYGGVTSSQNVEMPIAAGYNHSMAIGEIGILWVWGNNYLNQLGTSGGNAYYPDGWYWDNYGMDAPISLAAGTQYSMALTETGEVWVWGSQYSPCASHVFIEQTKFLDGVTTIAAGSYNRLAANSGNIWTWHFETQPENLDFTGVESTASGDSHYLVLKNDGTVWSWGSNSYGQLGIGNNGIYDSDEPIEINGLSDIVSVAAGQYHSVALSEDGTVWAWGANWYGQLGDGTTDTRWLPVQVIAPAEPSVPTTLTLSIDTIALQILTGGLTAQAEMSATIYDQYGGKMSADVTYSLETPYSGVLVDEETGEVTVTSNAQDGIVTFEAEYLGLIATAELSLYKFSSKVIQIEAGDYHTVALEENGTVWSWGANSDGLLGDGTTVDRQIPGKISGLEDIVEISVGRFHSIALKSDGTVWAWGHNWYGQLGDGTSGSGTSKSMPVQVLNLTDVAQIAAGTNHSLAAKNDGTVWSWGWNLNGQLGDGASGNAADKSTPVQVINLTDVIDIAAASTHSLALKNDGTLWSWGGNTIGQLGIGNTTSSSTPVQITSNNLDDVISIAAGDGHSFAIKADGTVWSWGGNWYGQLGDGTTADRQSPVQVTNISDAIGIMAGESHSIAVKHDGNVWSWGKNDFGQLGDDTIESKSTPSQVYDLSDVIAVGAGTFHSFAIVEDGSVWAWGWNGYGQLGDGTTDDRWLPVLVIHGIADDPPPGSLYLDITAGDEYLIALKGSEITSFENIIYTLTYDPNILQLIDFAAQTNTAATTPAHIAGTPLTIISHSGGDLTFSVDRTIPQGYTWSGTLTILRFEALDSGSTGISVE